VATGAGFLARSLAMKEEPVRDPARPIARGTPRDADRPEPAPKSEPAQSASARMTVAGRVLDPEGKPVPGAVVDLVARSRSPFVSARVEADQFTLLGQGQSDRDGRYRLDAPRTASTRVFEVYVMAAAPGYGLGWADLNPDAEQPAAEIRLFPEQPIRVRLV